MLVKDLLKDEISNDLIADIIEKYLEKLDFQSYFVLYCEIEKLIAK